MIDMQQLLRAVQAYVDDFNHSWLYQDIGQYVPWGLYSYRLNRLWARSSASQSLASQCWANYILTIGAQLECFLAWTSWRSQHSTIYTLPICFKGSQCLS